MTPNKYSLLGKTTALISFIIGMLIFGMYFFTSKSELLFLGFWFVVVAGIVNSIILIVILIKAKSNKSYKKLLFKTVGLMLLNLPIMVVCIWGAIFLLGTMRITFTNGTNNKLTDIKIVGCETKYIVALKPHESKTVWIGITGDCSIKIKYQENGYLKSEMVAGYVTHGCGHKLNHNIDGKHKDIP